MKEILWKCFAWLVSRRLIADLIIGHATRTPYFHLPGYMGRWWAWNRHDDGSVDEKQRAERTREERDPRSKFMQKFPSARVHFIMRADVDRNKHDHPFDFRTVVLRGWYREQRAPLGAPAGEGQIFFRARGDTATLNFGEYHNIIETPPEGVWTLFLGFDYRGTWGFDKDGVKIPWREYLGYE